jgi:hypothetical protein
MIVVFAIKPCTKPSIFDKDELLHALTGADFRN